MSREEATLKLTPISYCSYSHGNGAGEAWVVGEPLG